MYNSFEKQMPDFACYLVIEKDIVIYADDAFLELSGFERNEIINKKADRIFAEYLRLTYDKVNYYESSKVQSFMFTKLLECREVDISTVPAGDGTVYVTFTEIPDSRLEKKCPLINKLMPGNTAGVAIFAVKPDIILLKANQCYLDFFDKNFREPKNSIGRKIYEFLTGWIGSELEKVWKSLLKTGESIHLNEYLYDRMDRGVGYWESTLVPLNDGNDIKYVVEIAQEITESVLNKKQVEEQNRIISQQKEQLESALEMKNSFLSFLAHEFKTPLSVMYASVQAMEAICRNDLSERSIHYINSIKQNIFRQSRLINNLLDIVRVNSGRLTLYKSNIDIIFLTKAIIESVEIYAKQKELNLIFKTDIDSLVISVDDEKYERILLNLISNAIKFTPEGERINVNIALSGDLLCIEVKDNGIGIPEDKQVMIFERFGQVDNFKSRDGEGTGIGLSLVKLLVETLGGRITLESREGEGSSFKVYLPCVQAEPVEQVHCRQLNSRLVQSMQVEFSDIYL